MKVAEAQRNWDPLPGWLNTASYGLPPRSAWEAMQAALNDWRVGRVSWEGWDGQTQRARESFARLVGVDAGDVAVGSQVSQMLAPFASALPGGAHVLTPDNEFTSNLFPWLVQDHRGVKVTNVPSSRFADEITPGTDVVAFSLVQSAIGEVADYHAIVAAARTVGAMVVVDATQGCGWLPFDASLADVVVVAAYKWLMSPRGAAFAYVAPAVRDLTPPIAAGWYATEDPYSSYYGPPLRLSKSARRLDVSPAWFSWVAAAPTLELIEEIGIGAIEAHNVSLANRFLTGLGQPPGSSAIVIVDVPGAEERLAAAGVRAAVRAGRVRASFHVYSTERDVDMALEALAG